MSRDFRGVRPNAVLYPPKEEYLQASKAAAFSVSKSKKPTFYRFTSHLGGKDIVFSGNLTLDLFTQRHFISLSFCATYNVQYSTFNIKDETLKIERLPLTMELLVRAIMECYDIRSEKRAQEVIFEKLAELSSTGNQEAWEQARKLRAEIEQSNTQVPPVLIFSHSYLTSAAVHVGYFRMENMEQIALTLFPTLIYATPDEKQAVYYLLQKRPQDFFFAATCPPGVEPLAADKISKLASALSCVIDSKTRASIEFYGALMKKMDHGGATMLPLTEVMQLAYHHLGENGTNAVDNLVAAGILHQERLSAPGISGKTVMYYSDALLAHREDQLLCLVNRLCRTEMEWLCPPSVVRHLFHSEKIKKLLGCDQLFALLIMMTQGLNVVTGRGGVGKTHVLLVAAYLMARACPFNHIVLCTTTGKGSINLARRYKELAKNALLKEIGDEVAELALQPRDYGLYLDHLDPMADDEEEPPIPPNIPNTNTSLLLGGADGIDPQPEVSGDYLKLWEQMMNEALCTANSPNIPVILDHKNPTKEELYAVEKWAEMFHDEMVGAGVRQAGLRVVDAFKKDNPGLAAWYATIPHPHKEAEGASSSESPSSKTNEEDPPCSSNMKRSRVEESEDPPCSSNLKRPRVEESEGPKRKREGQDEGPPAKKQKDDGDDEPLPDRIAEAIQRCMHKPRLGHLKIIHRKIYKKSSDRKRGQLDGSFKTVEENLHISTVHNIIHMKKHDLEQLAFSQKAPVRLIIDEQLLDIGKLLELTKVFKTVESLSLVGDPNQLPPLGMGSLFHALLTIRERDLPYPTNLPNGRPCPEFFKSGMFATVAINRRVDPNSLEIVDFLENILNLRTPPEPSPESKAIRYHSTPDEQAWDNEIKGAFIRHKASLDNTDFIAPTRALAQRVNQIGLKTICPHIKPHPNKENQLGPGVCVAFLENFRSIDGTFYTNGTKKTIHSVYEITETKDEKKHKTYKAKEVDSIEM